MVAGPGIEPRSGAYETPELPLLYPAITIYGAQEETRTLNPKDMDLNHARIPIPPHVH